MMISQLQKSLWADSVQSVEVSSLIEAVKSQPASRDVWCRRVQTVLRGGKQLGDYPFPPFHLLRKLTREKNRELIQEIIACLKTHGIF